jgi:hypothetical protein
LWGGRVKVHDKKIGDDDERCQSKDRRSSGSC